MKLFLTFLSLIILSLCITPSVHASILPHAVILIPIAKTVSWIMSILSIPILWFGAVYAKLFKHSIKRTFVTIVACVLTLGILLITGIKLIHPELPIL